MSRIAIVASLAAVALTFAGCQSDEEKAAERQKLKDEIKQQVVTELTSMVSSEVGYQLRQKIEEHKRDLEKQKAEAEALKTAPKPPMTAPKANPPKAVTPSKTLKHH